MEIREEKVKQEHCHVKRIKNTETDVYGKNKRLRQEKTMKIMKKTYTKNTKNLS